MGRWIALAAAIALVGVAGVPGAGAQEDFPAVDQPGVSDDEIRVASLYTDEGDPTNGKYETAVDGAKAFFEYINKSEGGVYGRKLVVAAEHDDRLANNRQEVQAILSQDDVFAVAPVAAPLFAGAQLLVEAGVPTFGYHISAEWGNERNTPGPPNLFAQAGSYYCVPCLNPKAESFLTKTLKKKRLGVVAYGVSQSADCADGVEMTFEKYPTAKVVFVDKTIPYGTPDYSAQIAQMKEANVDFIYPCLDASATVLVAKEMRKQGLDATVLSPALYNPALVRENAEVLEGFYVNTTFVPFETKPKPQGLKLYDKWIKRTGGERTENSVIGWINAAQLVEGLKAAGPEFTQEKVVDAINQMTDFNAKGLLVGIDWTVAHEEDHDCFAISKIVDGKFKPVTAKSGKPFLCMPDDVKSIPANPPDGTDPADRY
jgi:ABC-type branched-subunit amino acid transport system substrate-binding protein